MTADPTSSDRPANLRFPLDSGCSATTSHQTRQHKRPHGDAHERSRARHLVQPSKFKDSENSAPVPRQDAAEDCGSDDVREFPRLLWTPRADQDLWTEGDIPISATLAEMLKLF